MKAFLTLTAVLEGLTGIILLTTPSVIISFLLGTVLDDPGTLIARLAGAALFSLCIVIWSYRRETHHVYGIGIALLFYNMAAGTLLIYAFKKGFHGVGMWPAVSQHLIFGIWCAYLLLKYQRGK